MPLKKEKIMRVSSSLKSHFDKLIKFYYKKSNKKKGKKKVMKENLRKKLERGKNEKKERKKERKKEHVVVFRGQNEDMQTREVGWNKYITITEQIYRIQVLYNS